MCRGRPTLQKKPEDCTFQEEEPDNWCHFIDEDEDRCAVPRSSAMVPYRQASEVNTVMKIGLQQQHDSIQGFPRRL